MENVSLMEEDVVIVKANVLVHQELIASMMNVNAIMKMMTGERMTKMMIMKNLNARMDVIKNAEIKIQIV